MHMYRVPSVLVDMQGRLKAQQLLANELYVLQTIVSGLQ